MSNPGFLSYPHVRRPLPSSTSFTSLLGGGSSSVSSDLRRSFHHPLLGSVYTSRQDAKAAIKLYELKTNIATMRSATEASGVQGSSNVALWKCATPSCSLLYIVRTQKGGWRIDEVSGEHISCAVTKSAPLACDILEQAPPFASLFARQKNSILSNVTPDALKAAGSQLGIPVSDSLCCKLKGRNTKRLAQAGRDGYRHLARFMQEFVRGNPGSIVRMRVKRFRPSAPGAQDTVSDIFSFSYTSSPQTGDVITSGTLPPEDDDGGRVVFHSCVVIPVMSFEILKLSSTSHAMDFARLFQGKKADENGNVVDDMQIGVLSTEFAGSDVGLVIALLTGNESAHMWSYVTKILKDDLPMIANPATMVKSDRPFHYVRRMMRETLRGFPSCCSVHLIRGVRLHVAKKEFNAHEKKLNAYLYATSDDDHRRTKAELAAASPKIMDKLIISEYDQQVFNPAEMEQWPHYKDSYTLHAVLGHCETTGGTTPHYKVDAHGPWTTSNNVERVNADMKSNGCRYQEVFLFFSDYLDRMAEKYNNIFAEISKHKDALLPNVHEVYRAATAASREYEVCSRGLGGWRVVKRRLTADGRDRKTNVNTTLNICQGRHCARVTFTREPCRHLICAYCDEGITQDVNFYEKKWPRRFLRSAVLEVFDRRSMVYTPPAVVGDEFYSSFDMGPPQKKVAPPTKPGVGRPPGRQNTNSTRWASAGDRGHFADTGGH
jgi:hypothetical protein